MLVFPYLCYNILMDNLEYLNHIAQSNRPVKRTSSAPISLIIKILLGGLVLFVLILSFGSMLGGKSTKSSDLVKQLYVRTTNLDSTINSYNKSLKSSKLRAIGISLSGILTSASSQLSAYISSTDSSKNALQPNEQITAEEVENINALNLSLENAKLNGILDRTYVTQIHLQVSLLLSMVSQLSSRNDNETLNAILESYISNLAVIEQSFQDYSSPGN